MQFHATRHGNQVWYWLQWRDCGIADQHVERHTQYRPRNRSRLYWAVKRMPNPLADRAYVVKGCLAGFRLFGKWRAEIRTCRQRKMRFVQIRKSA